MTDDLVAFLRARLDEDEQAALGTLDPLALIGRHRGKPEQRWKVTESGRAIIDADGNTLRAKDVFPAEAEHIVRHDPARVLAEVDAKRDVLRLAERAHDYHATFVSGFAAAMEDALRKFALAYADHPAYRAAWAPEA
jgi:hypothetical protein